MRKIFWENPYQRDLVTHVVSVKGNRILFDATIVFSFSGGQESDKALVNDFPILNSEIIDHLIYYTLPNHHELKPQDEIYMQIDWLRRYRLMRLHFAAELVLEIVTKKWNFKKIGAHISETKARIDFICDKNISNLFDNIITEYNAVIANDKPIITGFTDTENQIRFWEIEGFSKVACGGTHVKSTAEVGYVTLKRINIGGGKERIEIKLINP